MNGKDTFSVTIDNLSKAVLYSKKCGFTVTVNHTIFPGNFHDTESMIRFVAGIGVKRCRFHFTFPGDSERNTAVKEEDMQNQDNIAYIMPEDWVGLYNRCKSLSKELGIEIQIARVYGSSEVSKSKYMKPHCLHVQYRGELLMCNLYSRLSDSNRHTFATIVDGNQIKLNSDCALYDYTRDEACCNIMSEVTKQLPEYVSERINKVGIGCIYLQQSPLA